MSIERKVRWGGLGLLLALMVAVAITAFNFDRVRFGGELHHKNQQISDLVADILPPPEYVIEAYLETTKLMESPATFSTRSARLAKLHDDFTTRKKYWEQSDLDPALKSPLLERTAVEADAFWQEVEGSFLPAIQNGDLAKARLSYARVEQYYAAHRREVDALVQAAAVQQRDLAASTRSTIMMAVAIVTILCLAVLLLTGVAIWFVGKRVIAPLRNIIDALKRLAAGDWTTKVDGQERQDEMGELSRVFLAFRDQLQAAERETQRQTEIIVSSIGEGLSHLAAGDVGFRVRANLNGPFAKLEDDFNSAAESLSCTLRMVSLSTHTLGNGTEEIRHASDDLSLRTEKQAASLEETSAAMSEITGTVAQTANHAGQAQEIVSQACGEAKDSHAVVRKAVEAMANIERSSSEIADIVSVIDGIAFQTNLLALNAGVEAARAGEDGKGFAVVASEVRALALRASDAAMDIRQRINASGGHVAAGVTLVGETGDALSSILERIGQIGELVASIATAARGQADTLRQVNIAVREMDGVTQQNAAMVEQSTAATRTLAAEADKLKDQIAKFRVETGSPYSYERAA